MKGGNSVESEVIQMDGTVETIRFQDTPAMRPRVLCSPPPFLERRNVMLKSLQDRLKRKREFLGQEEDRNELENMGVVTLIVVVAVTILVWLIW